MISAIVLAAGEGTRFGGTKQVERLRGRPLVQHAVDAAAEGGIEDVVVVVGHDAERVRAAVELPPGGRVVVNDRYAEGQSTSLSAGLRALGASSEAAIVLLADQPGIEARHVRSLRDAFGGAPDAEILRIGFRDGPGPALLARSVWEEAASTAGDTGARALFEEDPDRIRWVTLDEDVPRDVDRPGDLERERTTDG
ncbi:MAG TPA: nucleotidyltransferase family protein [Actinomycetota bacterium]|nr:nucleotidyltransferase family protein [Actinomycetota bacterium]